MRRPAVIIALAAIAVLGAILAIATVARARDRRAAPHAAAAPDPRLQAAFTAIFQGASAAAEKARALHESDLLSATRFDD